MGTSNIRYRETEDLKLQMIIPYCQSEIIDCFHSGDGSTPQYIKYSRNEKGAKRIAERDTKHSYEKDMLTRDKKHKMDSKSDSPGANPIFRQHPYFEYITVKSQETESNHV